MKTLQALASRINARDAVASAVSQRDEADALEAALADMMTVFCSDFANGLMGQRHNTYGHRSRILRQMAGRLTAMRAEDGGFAS